MSTVEKVDNNRIVVIPAMSDKYESRSFIGLDTGSLIEFKNGEYAIFCECSTTHSGFGLFYLESFVCESVDVDETCEYRILANPVLSYTEPE